MLEIRVYSDISVDKHYITLKKIYYIVRSQLNLKYLHSLMLFCFQFINNVLVIKINTIYNIIDKQLVILSLKLLVLVNKLNNMKG